MPPALPQSPPTNGLLPSISRARPGRLCGTAGCELPDFHVGPCSCMNMAAKRQSIPVIPTATVPAPERECPPRAVRSSSRETDAAPHQELLPNGLKRFYHGQRWGVPLPDGQVSEDLENSDDEVDDGWRLQQAEQRIKARQDISLQQASLMHLWNAHVAWSPPVVSDRMLPEVCRRFAFTHVDVLARALRQPFLLHLFTLWEHNLLHHEDVNDCIHIVNTRNKCSVSKSRSQDYELGNSTHSLCSECLRPSHERHCTLYRVPHGAAAWPASNSIPGTEVVPIGVWESSE